MTNRVRQAVHGDADTLFALVSRFATSFRPDRSAFDKALAELLSAGDARLLVAERDGTIIGYLLGFDHWTLFANGRAAWIEELFVTEDQRRNGVGAELVNAFETWCDDRGARLIALATRRAAPFYRQLNYEESAIYFRKLASGKSP